jgi:Fe-S-cluster-containing dehydrogenase component
MATKTKDIEEESPERLEGRRAVLLKIASTVFAGLVAPAILEQTAARAQTQPATGPLLPALPDPEPGEDPLIRMMRDLQRALQKPVEQRRWVMVIDLRKCIGCHACTIGCVAENKLPPGVVYRPVLEEEIGTFPNVTRRFLPRPCMQCDDPPCVPVCPVNATYKNSEGVTVVDYEQCIGCRYCITACPYGARTFDFGKLYADETPAPEMAAYERQPNFEYGRLWDREEEKSPIGNVRKCHFCLHRVRKGMLPMCVSTCVGRATFFGDANDTTSLVAKLIARPNVMRLKEEMGTNPRVYYLT